MRMSLVLAAAVPLVCPTAAATVAAQADAGQPEGYTCSRTSSANACEHGIALATRHTVDGLDRSERPVVLRFKDVRGDPSSLDVGAPGASPGDTEFFDNTLYNRSGTRTVGRFPSRCTQVTGTEYACHGTLLLGGSQLDLATTTDFGDEAGIVASVVGGTGRFFGAAGQVSIAPTGTPGTSRLVVRLAGR